ncbi:MAG: STAS domain-containing protein [Planctomycetes bacterium]|nr:STAS domain-containing protein [Planctomycetota bacterium]
MGKLRGYFEVATWEKTVYIRVVGLANFNNSHLFKDFVDEMLERSYRRFYVDLAGCQGIDSTFMGVLLGIHLYPKTSGDSGAACSVVVVNANPHNRKLLNELGLVRIIQVAEAPVQFPEGVHLERLGEERFDPDARIRLIKKAHENLVALDERNREKFAPFLEALARELGKS